MRYRLMATYRGVPYEAGVGPSDDDVVLFAACPPPEELGFEPATGHWRKQLQLHDVQGLWESRPVGTFRGKRCIVLDDLGDRLHIAYRGHDAYQAEQLGYWEVDRGVFELVTPRDEVTEIVEERLDYPRRAAGSEPVPPAFTAPQPAVPHATGPQAAVPGPGAPNLSGPLAMPHHTAPQPTVPPATGPQPAVRDFTGQQPAIRDFTGPQPAVRDFTGPQPAIRESTGQQPAIRDFTGQQPAIRDFTGQQPAIRESTGQQPAIRESTGQQPAGNGTGTPASDLAVIPPTREPPLPLEAAARRAASARVLLPDPAPEPGPEPAAQPPRASAPKGAGRADPPPTRRRRAAQRRQATQRVFSELAGLAAIPPSAYAVGEEVDGAMCLINTPDGFEVFNAAAGARHEVRIFDDEESAYFYLFGVLAAEAVRTGRLAPQG